MNKLLIIVFLATSFIGHSQAQLESNINSKTEYLKVEKKLKKVCKNILVQYKADPVFIKNFKLSQKTWIKLREIELAMKYPKKEKGFYGSVHSTCINLYLKELTEKRIEKLMVWIQGIEEGDVCIGSVRRLTDSEEKISAK